MRWVNETWSTVSEKNGAIRCERNFGTWCVTVQGCTESSSYMRALWRRAARRLPRDFRAKRILMLGLAAGCSIDDLHRRFPGCHITAVEWDPTMLKVMDTLKVFTPKHRPTVMLGDAAEVVPKLTGEFDLILYDLYCGAGSPAHVAGAEFFAALRPLLARDGYLIVNALTQHDMLAAAGASFSFQSSWKYLLNEIALYKPLGAGTVGDPLPEGYVQFRGSRAFLARDYASFPKVSMVGTDDAPGFRYWIGPFGGEKYFGDVEPTPDPGGPKRLVIWQRITRREQPPGWRRAWARMNPEATGFVNLRTPGDPFARWAPHALRHLKRWRSRRDQWDVVDVTMDEFLAAYMTSAMKTHLKVLHRKIMLLKARDHGPLLRLFAFRRRATGAIEAGFAALDVPELKQSIHIASFILESAKDDGAGTGLIEEWFRHGLDRGLWFLDFDLFRAEGGPRAWRGFSRFKGQFGTTFVRYPKPLTRWVGTWRGLWEHLRSPRAAAK
jgi:hypothetical protein